VRSLSESGKGGYLQILLFLRVFLAFWGAEKPEGSFISLIREALFPWAFGTVRLQKGSLLLKEDLGKKGKKR